MLYIGKKLTGKEGSIQFFNDFNFADIKRFYQISAKKGQVRAWHGHKKEGKYVYVISGTINLGWVSMKTENSANQVLSASKPQIQFIPPGYYNGFKALTNAKVIFFSTTSLEDSLDDDFREPAEKWCIW